MSSQKTFMKKTAGAYLKTAQISEMKSGDFCVTCEELEGCTVITNDHGDMVISNFGGHVATLEMSNKAYGTLLELEASAERKYFDKHPEAPF